MSPAAELLVSVCRGVTCQTFLADEVYRAFVARVAAAGLAQVRVTRSGCTSRCGGGVTVRVGSAAPARDDDPFGPSVLVACAATEQGGAGSEGGEGACPEVSYPEVHATDVPRIVEQHLQGGVPVEALRVARASFR